jgi:plastocyanin
MAFGKRRTAKLIAGLALLGVLLVSAPATACLKSHHGGILSSGARPPQDPVITQADEVTVEIRDYDFVPRDLTVPLGAVITWVNRDGVPHDATSKAGRWAAGMIKPGEERSLAFDDPGAFDYICTIHPEMKATLVVRPDDAADTSTAEEPDRAA